MKRNLGNKFILFALLAATIATSCKKDFLDINSNPNAATTAGPELVLPGALATTAANMNPMASHYSASPQTWFEGWMGYWAISGSYAISSSDFSTYKMTTSDANAFWQGLYDNLNDYNYVEVQAKAQNKPFYVAAAKVMKAYNFQVLVDLFGDVPYTEAFGGTANIHPKYDNGQTIYEDLIKQIDTAITLFHRSDAQGDANSDIMFGGDNDRWIRFANTLELRILMRQTQMSGRAAYIQSNIAKIVTEGSGFLKANEDASANPGYTNSTGKASPFWGANYNVSGTYTNDYWRANQYSINFFKNEKDPRLTQIYAGTPSDPTKYQGNSLGQISGLTGSNSSVFGPGVLQSATQDAIIMPASESFFLQAEAALRGWLSSDPKTLYQQGVTESFRIFHVPGYATAAATYYSQPNDKNVNWNATTNFNERLALIIRQKWASENTLMAIEAYDDYRRLGLPADIPLSVSPYVDVKQIPVRFLYPFSEYQTNAENVPQQAANANHTSKIFWMP